MQPPVVDIDLLHRISVPLLVYEAHRRSRMTACLVGPDVVLTSPSVAELDHAAIDLQVEGESRTGRLELVDDVAGVAVVRFDPAVQWDLSRVFSTREQTIRPGAGFLTLVNLGEDRPLVSLSGTVLGATTRNGKPFYVGEVESAAIDGAGGIAGAPVVVEGRVLGLITGGTRPGRGEGRWTFLIAPFSAMQGTKLAEGLVALGLADRTAELESLPDQVLAPADPEGARLFEMLSPRAQHAVSRADAMRRAMQFESVHIRQLVAAMQQESGSLAAAALGAAGIDERGLRDLMARITGDILPEAVQADALATLPPLSLHAREAVVAASRLSSDGMIHLGDLFAGAMSVTGSSFIRALIELGVQVPPHDAADLVPALEVDPIQATPATAAPKAAPDSIGATAPVPAATIAALATALAGFRSDGVSDQDDLLDIERDVAALCSVIAARDVEPPLSIGLFGDWGSGKSFFLASMRRQLERIEKAADAAERAAIASGRPPGGATRYCARITQLEFNAWRYIDTDLWASLADGIIDGLSRALERSKLDKVTPTERARLLAAAAHSRDVIAQAEADKSVAESNLRDQERVLAQARARAEAPARGAAAIRQEARVLAIATTPALRDELTEVTRQLGASAASAEAKATLLDLKGLWGTARAVWQAIRASSGAAVAGAAVLGAVLAATAVFHDQIEAAIRYPVAAAIAVMTAVSSLQPYLKRARRAVASIEQIVDKHGGALKTAQEEATRQERAKREQLAAAVEAAEHRRTEARRDLDQLETQLIALRADQQMAAFLKERQASDDYRKHLGVIARARSDFERMSDLLFRTRDDAPKPGLPRIDRIVLYIDDLDRCDEEQVVKVLQAVHLLLAFKLFVVVVAVDSRWLLRSLQQHSSVFRADAGADQGLSEEERLHWQSTPLNYLEKIFQIPFTLRPMAAAGFANLIDHLVGERAKADADGKTGGVVKVGVDTAAAGAGPSPIAAAAAAPAVPTAAGPAPTVATAAAPAAPTAANPGEPAAPTAVTTAKATSIPPPAAGKPSGPSSPIEPPAFAPARPADAPVDVLPPHLVIEAWEQAFMKQFHELITTPRAAKRFVNIYRLLKARVPDERAAAFRGDASGGEHRAAIFLLAVLIGYPSETTDMMRELTEEPGAEDWWPWLLTYLTSEKQKAAVRSAQHERPPEPDARSAPPGRPDQAAARSAHEEQLAELAAKLALLRRRFADQDLALPSTEVFRFWTPYVARFSFQAGRLSAAVIPPEPPAAQADPAPRTPRTVAGSSPPRDRSEAS